MQLLCKILFRQNRQKRRKRCNICGYYNDSAGFISALFGIMAASKFPGLESSTMALPSVVMIVSPWVAGILLSVVGS